MAQLGRGDGQALQVWAGRWLQAWYTSCPSCPSLGQGRLGRRRKEAAAAIQLLPPPSPGAPPCTPQVDARQLAKQLLRSRFSTVLALGEAVVLPWPAGGSSDGGDAGGGARLLLRVTAVHTLDQQAREEAVGYHCYRGGCGRGDKEESAAGLSLQQGFSWLQFVQAWRLPVQFAERLQGTICTICQHTNNKALLPSHPPCRPAHTRRSDLPDHPWSTAAAAAAATATSARAAAAPAAAASAEASAEARAAARRSRELRQQRGRGLWRGVARAAAAEHGGWPRQSGAPERQVSQGVRRDPELLVCRRCLPGPCSRVAPSL